MKNKVQENLWLLEYGTFYLMAKNYPSSSTTEGQVNWWFMKRSTSQLSITFWGQRESSCEMCWERIYIMWTVKTVDTDQSLLSCENWRSAAGIWFNQEVTDLHEYFCVSIQENKSICYLILDPSDTLILVLSYCLIEQRVGVFIPSRFGAASGVSLTADKAEWDQSSLLLVDVCLSSETYWWLLTRGPCAAFPWRFLVLFIKGS